MSTYIPIECLTLEQLEKRRAYHRQYKKTYKKDLTEEELQKRRAYQKEYKQKRIQEVNEYHKEYYQKNKHTDKFSKAGYCEYCKVNTSNKYQHNLTKKHIAALAIEKLNLEEPPEPKEPTIEQMKKCFEYEGTESGEEIFKKILALRATEYNSACAKAKAV